MKKAHPSKFSSAEHREDNGKYELVHSMKWNLSSTGWTEIRKYMLQTQAFKPSGPGALLLALDKNTRIELVSDSATSAKVFIIHYLTPDEAKTLTGEAEKKGIESKLKSIMKNWYEKGKISA